MTSTTSLGELPRPYEREVSCTRLVRRGSAAPSGDSKPPSTPRDPATRPLLDRLEIGGQQFGFWLLDQLGDGRFARVFLAKQPDLAGRLVVLKFSTLEGAEPQTLALLQHTHIVPIYSVHEDESADLRAVCMPYFGGASLAHVLDVVYRGPALPIAGAAWSAALAEVQSAAAGPAKPIDPQTPRAAFARQDHVRTAVWIVARLAEAVDHAHRHGVIHRDIKPSNILLAGDGQPLLLDFNVAKDAHLDPSLSIVGGTATYAAPEHLRALLSNDPAHFDRVDRRSDIYSLGLVLLKALTGRNPFEPVRGHSDLLRREDIESWIDHRPVPSARGHRPDVPWSLESVLRKCLDNDPERRYQDAGSLAEDLNRFLDDRPLRFAPEPSRRERIRKWTRRHPRLTIVGLAAAAMLTILGGVGIGVGGLRRDLRDANRLLTTARDRERLQAFETGNLRALCLVNTVTDVHDHLREGAAVCEETLGLFDVLDRDDWQSRSAWLRLAEEDRPRIAGSIRDLLLLLAWARRHIDPDLDPAANLALLDRAEAIAGLPPSRALAMCRSHLLRAAGRADEAATARQVAESTAPAGAQDHYLIAATHARRGTADALRQAIAELDRAAELQPTHYWVLTQRGICRQELGQHDLALADFSSAIGVRPDLAWGWFNRGYVLGKSGHAAEAIRDFTAAIARAPDFVEAYLNRGLIRLEAKQPTLALADLDRARDLGRNDAFLHASRGVALENLKRFADADAAFALARSRAGDLPDKSRARILWAYGSAVALRLPERARDAFDEVLRSDPAQPQALYGLGVLAAERGTLAEAIARFDRAIAADPSFVDPRRGRAILHARLGRWDSAGADINWCLEREPRRGVTLYAAACVSALAAAQHPAVADQAVALLEKAFADGYGRDKATSDPDLAALRRDPRFRALVDRDIGRDR
jgi:eukaryotic-like serine/threonine-protein kinase